MTLVPGLTVSCQRCGAARLSDPDAVAGGARDRADGRDRAAHCVACDRMVCAGCFDEAAFRCRDCAATGVGVVALPEERPGEGVPADLSAAEHATPESRPSARGAAWRLFGHAAVAAGFAGLATLAVIGAGPGEGRGQAGGAAPGASEGIAVAPPAESASAAPTRTPSSSPAPSPTTGSSPAATHSGGGRSPEPTAQADRVRPARLSFDDLSMADLGDASWLASAVGAEVSAFPTAVDRSIRLGGAGGGGSVCVHAEGIGSSPATVAFDIYSRAPLSSGALMLSFDDVQGPRAAVDVTELGAPVPEASWVRISVDLAGESPETRGWLLASPSPLPLAPPQPAPLTAERAGADRVCILATDGDVHVDNLVIEP